MKKYFELTYQQLLIYGVHLGHSFANSIMYAAWLVYTYRDNMLIMNIFKTFYTMKIGFKFISRAVSFRAPVWFINLDRSAGLYSRMAAYSCGEASWTIKWANGVLVNYLRFHEVYKWLMQTSSEWAYKGKNKWVTHQYFDWKLTRSTWPRVVLVSSVFHSKAPVKEALYLGIPCIGIVDTNVNTNRVILAVPGNDESLECLAFYSDVISNFILVKKFSLINSWFMLRRPKRNISFKLWLRNKSDSSFKTLEHVSIDFKLHLSHIFPIINIEKNLMCSFNSIFGRNDKFKTTRYSYLDFRECEKGKFNELINKRSLSKGLAFFMQSQRWWLTFLGHAHFFKNRLALVLGLD